MQEAAHIEPGAFLAYLADRRGIEAALVQAPPVLVGTFQAEVWQGIAARLALTPDPFEGAGAVRLARAEHAGRELLVAQFPVGAPAAVLLQELLIARGVRRLLFVGSAGSLQPDLPIGSLALIDAAAVREDGTSFHYLPAEVTPRAAPALLAALRAAASARGLVVPEGGCWTTDAVYRELTSKVARYAARGVLAVEMEAAALYAVAALRGVEAALIVAMSDELFHPWLPGFHRDEYRAGILTALEIALAAAATL